MKDMERIRAARNLAESARVDMEHILNLNAWVDAPENTERQAKSDVLEIRMQSRRRLQVIESDLNTAMTTIRDLRFHFGSDTD